MRIAHGPWSLSFHNMKSELVSSNGPPIYKPEI